MITTALLLALTSQDADVERLVRDLGDARLEVRAEATERLLRLGTAAVDAVGRAAADPSDAERRARARLILRAIGPVEPVEVDERRQRPRRLRLVTLHLSDAPLGDVLLRLRDQTGLEFAAPGVDRERRVWVDAREVPLSRVLHDVGLAATGRQDFLEEAGDPGGTVVHAEGARFAFAIAPWPAEGPPQGYVVTTKAHRDLEGDLWLTVAGVRAAGVEHPVETCARHSPGMVFVRAAALEAPTVTIRAGRRWTCEHAVHFDRPRRGDVRRVGSFELTLDWPRVVVRADRPWPEAVLRRTLYEHDIRVVLKPREEPVRDSIGAGGGGGGVYGTRLGGKKNLVARPGTPPPPAWCGCLGEPSRATPPPLAQAREHAVTAWGADPLNDIESIVVTFRRPVEETFDVVSPPLR